MSGAEDLTALIEARGAAVRYEGAPAPSLTGIELSLPAGELVILLGPNGGGKTTLLRAIAGELAGVAGSLVVRSAVTYLPQRDLSRTDFPVTALDVALMGTLAERRFWQRPRRADRDRAREALATVGLAARAGDSYGELSGGQRRRVLLARTIVQRAPVILLDEPLAGVDPASDQAIRSALLTLRDSGRLVLVASHDLEHAREADRVLCLNRRLVANGAPRDVLTEQLLRETYGAELTLLPGDGDGASVGVVEHHHHEH